MKIIKYTLFICLAAFFTQCSPEDTGSFGEKIDRTAQLIGTWKVTTVYQVDLDAEKKSFPEYATKVDITNVLTNMPFSDFEMTLNDGTIATNIGNSAMNYIIEEGQGTWSFITNDELELVNSVLGINASNGITVAINGKETVLLISTFTGLNGTNPVINLSYKRTDASGNDVTRYEYILEKL